MTDNILTEDIDINSVPEKFRDKETGALKAKPLIESYTELEKRLSKIPTPPKSAEDYCVDCSHGLFEPDTSINQRLHEKGLTQDQVQFVYDLAAETMVPMIMEMAGDFQADQEIEKLVNHFGGPEKWKEVSRQLLAFGQKSLPADVLDSLASSYDGVIALHRMMKSGEPGLSAKGQQPADGQNDLDLQSMMRDPKYWRDKDPSFVAKVTEGFQKLYGNK